MKTAVVYAGTSTTPVAGTDGAYTINAQSFKLVNDNSSVTENTQVRFKTITIEYYA